MKHIKRMCAALLCMLYSLCFAEPDLAKYLENDLELQRLALEVKKAELSARETAIDKGVNVKLSTGTATFTNRNGSFNVSFNPSASVSVPGLSNLNAGVSSSVTVENGQNNTDNTKLSLSADIISGTAAERKLSLMSAQRTLLNAKRSLQDRALEAEKEYYSELKALFTSENNIIQAQKNLYDHTISFEEIKAKGYSASSSKYRQAELQVISDKHNIETKKRELEHDCAVFAAKCGIMLETNESTKDFLPKSIPTTQSVDIDSFKKETYKKIEQAEWNHAYNSLARTVDKNFTLAANTGYTIKNSATASSSASLSKSDTVDFGANAGLYGLKLAAGVSLPVIQNGNPVYTFSLSVDPNKFAKARIASQKNGYSEEQELIAVKSASDDYNTSVVAQKQSLNDIQWSKQAYSETYEMYVRLEKDMAEHLKAGIITESEYLNAYAGKEQYRIQLLINNIDLILYNNTTKLLFCRDDEIL